jgi:hypothetical protein
MVLNVVAGARRHNEDESLISYDVPAALLNRANPSKIKIG